jgi:hypothetical protein
MNHDDDSTSLADRQASASHARWAKRKWRSKKARSEFARYVSSHKTAPSGGRPRETDRCACGQFTRTRAKSRGHKCEAIHTQK